MRILLLLDDYEEGPMGSVVYRLCQRWAPEKRLVLSTLAFSQEGPLAERLRTLGLGTRTFPVRTWRDLLAAKEFGAKLLARDDRPDLVHAHGAWPLLAARAFHGGHPGVPLLGTVHSSQSNAPTLGLLQWPVEKFTRKWFALLTASTERLHRRLRTLEVPEPLLRLIPMGVDGVQCFPLSSKNRERFRTLLAVPQDAPLLVVPGPLTQAEAELLLDASAQLHGRFGDMRIFVIGAGPSEAFIEASLDTRRLRATIRLIGGLSEIASKVYSAADLVMYIPVAEEFPLPVAEALAAATPVVAFAGGAVADLVQDGFSGRLLTRQSGEALALAVGELLRQPEQRHQFGQAARERLLENHEVSSTCDAYMRLWKTLAPDAAWKTTDMVRLEDLEEFRRESEEIARSRG